MLSLFRVHILDNNEASVHSIFDHMQIAWVTKGYCGHGRFWFECFPWFYEKKKCLKKICNIQSNHLLIEIVHLKSTACNTKDAFFSFFQVLQISQTGDATTTIGELSQPSAAKKSRK